MGVCFADTGGKIKNGPSALLVKAGAIPYLIDLIRKGSALARIGSRLDLMCGDSPRASGKGFDAGPPQVVAGSFCFWGFRYFPSLSSGFRWSFLPSRPYRRVCVLVAVSVDKPSRKVHGACCARGMSKTTLRKSWCHPWAPEAKSLASPKQKVAFGRQESTICPLEPKVG